LQPSKILFTLGVIQNHQKGYKKRSIENLFALVSDGSLSTKWAAERAFEADYATTRSASDDRANAFSKPQTGT
jgi:hypothetical protein